MATENYEEELIYTPDEIDDDSRNGLSCFKDQRRQCGPDCMAFLGLGQAVPSKILTEQQSSCLELVMLERTARSTTISAQLLKDIADRSKRSDADKQRADGMLTITGPYSSGKT